MKEFLQTLMELIKQEIVKSEGEEMPQELSAEGAISEEIMPEGMESQEMGSEEDELGEYIKSSMTRPESNEPSRMLFGGKNQVEQAKVSIKKKK
jgi:hypothetical protein